MFRRLGSWCHDHRRLVVVAVITLLLGNGVAGRIGEADRQEVLLDGLESTNGFALIKSGFGNGSASAQTGQIVFTSERGVDDPAVRTAMETMLRRAV